MEVAGMQVINDKLKFKVRPDGGGLVVKVSLEQETESETMETEVETGFAVRFDKLYEYRKQTTSGIMTRSASDDAYQFGTDEIVQEWDLDEWTDISGVTTDGDLLKFSATALGIAKFGFTIAQSDSADISANRMKIDFTLDGYNWTSDDTFLALISHIETENDVKVKDENEENEGEDADMAQTATEANIDFSKVSNLMGYSAFGTYSWVPTAEATTSTNTTDGRFLEVTETVNVVATTAAEDVGMAKQNIAFSFLTRGANKIYWDPEAGVGYNVEGSSANSGVPSSGVWMVPASLAMVTVAASMMLL
jgi:hypothetical protein